VLPAIQEWTLHKHLLERLAFLAPDPVPELLLAMAMPGVEGE
jgi:hypothetical protein